MAAPRITELVPRHIFIEDDSDTFLMTRVMTLLRMAYIWRACRKVPGLPLRTGTKGRWAFLDDRRTNLLCSLHNFPTHLHFHFAFQCRFDFDYTLYCAQSLFCVAVDTMGGLEDAFSNDPFDDLNQQRKSPNKKSSSSSSRRTRGVSRAKSVDAECLGYEDTQQSQEPVAAPRQRNRARRRASLASPAGPPSETPSQELVLPGGDGEKSRRRRGGGGGGGGGSVDGSVMSYNSNISSVSGSGSRPRRGRRASMAGSTPPTTSLSQSAHTPEPDYGYEESARPTLQRSNSSDVDYGYGPSNGNGPAAPRRRGRRMSIGAPTVPVNNEVDYGYGGGGGGGSEQDAYDAKFGGGASKELDEEPAQPQRTRGKRVVGISDIKNADLASGSSGTGTSSRQLGANPRPTNSMVTPMTIPDVEKPRRQRRASMLGAVGGAVGAVGGAVVGTVGTVAGAAVGVKVAEDGEGKGRPKMFKNRKGRDMSSRDLLSQEDLEHKHNKSSERFRQGTMMERFG